MNRYNITRKLIAIILGAFWGYRVNLVIEKGISVSDYLISFGIVAIFLFSLGLLISKEKKTSDFDTIKREIWEDVIWAIVSLVLGFLLPLAFNLIFV